MSADNTSEISSNSLVRPRGIANTRLDTFVDAAFAFGSTVLLISSGELPSTYEELISLLKDIPAFALSYFTMMVFWLSHRSWSRTFGLEDKITIPLTLLLVLSLLVYIYPLKLMYSSLLMYISGGYFPSGIQVNSQAEGVGIIGFYGFGFAILSFSMLALYWRTHAMRESLKLNDAEQLNAKSGLVIWAVLMSTALLSGSIALFAPVRYGVWAGMLYILLSAMPFFTYQVKKRFEK